MSEPRRSLTCAGVALLGIALVAGEAVGQSERERALRAEVYATREAANAARIAVDSARAGTIALADRTTELDGVTVRWAEGSFAAADFDRIVDGIEAARASLDSRFGAAGTQLLHGFRVQVLAPSRQRVRRPAVRLVASTEASGRGASFSPPVDRSKVTAYILGQVGEQLRSSHPTLHRYPHVVLSLDDSPQLGAQAAASLAYGNSAPGRQCIAGALGACRAILTDAAGDRAKELWYDAEDAPAIVRSTQHYTVRSAAGALAAARKSCLEDGLASACHDAVGMLSAVYPYAGLVRGTFVAHAIALGGQAGLDRWAAETDQTAEPIAVLARVAGVSEDSLIASWQRATRGALDTRRRGTAPLAASAVAWCALMLLGATRRRPR